MLIGFELFFKLNGLELGLKLLYRFHTSDTDTSA